MKRHHDPASIALMIAAQQTHQAPAIDVLKSELRSDSVIDVPPPPKEPDPYYIIIKWKFVIPLCHFDKFHGYLATHEDKIAADVADLKVGAAYLGTYAEVPHGNPHQLFWAYSSLSAIDAFKAALVAKPKSALRKSLADLVALIDDPNVVMHRLVRASSLAGRVEAARKKDPILDMFAG
ncbi:MAG: hypothetical protein U1F15_09440 [Burkholderiales bacterium]